MRSYYSNARKDDPKIEEAAKKAAAMWPNSTSVTKAREKEEHDKHVHNEQSVEKSSLSNTKTLDAVQEKQGPKPKQKQTSTKVDNPPKTEAESDKKDIPKKEENSKPASIKDENDNKTEKPQPKHASTEERTRYNKKIIAAGIVVVVICLIVALVVALKPITVAINGTEIELSGDKTLGTAIEAAGLDLHAGDLIAIDGSVIEEGAGEAIGATINDSTYTTDLKKHLSNRDIIEAHNGNNVEEDFDITTESVPFSANVDGVGAIHTLEGEGVDGSQEVKRGKVSGIEIAIVTKEPVNISCKYYNANSGGEKVVALTFDDGPNATYTPQILDVLSQNEAHATFFTIGSQIKDSCVEIVQRASNEGHQICTHSWDHASGSGGGVNLSFMTKDEQIDEITKGYEAIQSSLGTEASHVIRTPGGNFPPDVIANLSPLITHEIGWNIDTTDWKKPGKNSIKSAILNAKPGDIILMHDGGGDRSQTVEALSEALPQLKKAGYRFVTVDELLQIDANNR